MAIEIEEVFVEARASLGCVLMELGQNEFAIATFRGALDYHPDFPDVHYHLARLLDESGKPEEATTHWEAFLQLAPKSPWADEARNRLQ
jgi:tetratricopeptide (TPR) repeat protein